MTSRHEAVQYVYDAMVAAMPTEERCESEPDKDKCIAFFPIHYEMMRGGKVTSFEVDVDAGGLEIIVAAALEWVHGWNRETAAKGECNCNKCLADVIDEINPEIVVEEVTHAG